MDKFIERVIEWNVIAGNKRGDYDNPNWVGVHRQLQLLREEQLETKEAVEKRDRIESIDGCVDVCVVAVGLMHRLGLNADQIKGCMDEVLSSNESKFTCDKRVALETVQKYGAEGSQVQLSDAPPYVMKVASEGGKQPIGKILKAVTYRPPDLQAVMDL